MQVVEIILTILQALASVALIVVVLLQSGKESGLGAIAGSSDSYMGKNKSSSLDAILASSTKWIALAWLVLVLCLSFFLDMNIGRGFSRGLFLFPGGQFCPSVLK